MENLVGFNFKEHVCKHGAPTEINSNQVNTSQDRVNRTAQVKVTKWIVISASIIGDITFSIG